MSDAAVIPSQEAGVTGDLIKRAVDVMIQRSADVYRDQFPGFDEYIIQCMACVANGISPEEAAKINGADRYSDTVNEKIESVKKTTAGWVGTDLVLPEGVEPEDKLDGLVSIIEELDIDSDTDPESDPAP